MRKYTRWFLILLLVLGFLGGSVRAVFATCDGFAAEGSTHRNAGNGCTYTCSNGSWSGPNQCDGQGNGQFQGPPPQTAAQKAAQANAVAQFQQAAQQQVAKQEATAPGSTAAIAAQTAAQRSSEATRQQAMVETQRQATVDLAKRMGASAADIAKINADAQAAAQSVSQAQGTTRGQTVVGSNAQNAADIATNGYDPTGALGTGNVNVSGGQIGTGTARSTTTTSTTTDAEANASTIMWSGAGACDVSRGTANSVAPGGTCCRGGVTECTSGTCSSAHASLGESGKCADLSTAQAAAAVASMWKIEGTMCRQCSASDDTKVCSFPSLANCNGFLQIGSRGVAKPVYYLDGAQCRVCTLNDTYTHVCSYLTAECGGHAGATRTVADGRTCDATGNDRCYCNSTGAALAGGQICPTERQVDKEGVRNCVGTVVPSSGSFRHTCLQGGALVAECNSGYHAQGAACLPDVAPVEPSRPAATNQSCTNQSVMSSCRSQNKECIHDVNGSDRCATPTPENVSGNTCTLVSNRAYAQACGNGSGYICSYGPGHLVDHVWVCPDQQGRYAGEAATTVRNVAYCSEEKTEECNSRRDGLRFCFKTISGGSCSRSSQSLVTAEPTPTPTPTPTPITYTEVRNGVTCDYGHQGACSNGFLCLQPTTGTFRWEAATAAFPNCRVTTPYCSGEMSGRCDTQHSFCTPTLTGGTCADSALINFANQHCPGVVPVRQSNGQLNCPSAGNFASIPNNECNLPLTTGNARPCGDGSKSQCVYGTPTLVNGHYVCPNSNGSIVQATPTNSNTYLAGHDCPINLDASVSPLVVNSQGQTTCVTLPDVTETQMNSYVAANCPGSVPVYDAGRYRCPNDRIAVGDSCAADAGANAAAHGQSRESKFCCNGRWMQDACTAPMSDNLFTAPNSGSALGGNVPNGTWCGNATSDHGCSWCIGGNSNTHVENGKAVCGPTPVQLSSGSAPSCAQDGQEVVNVGSFVLNCCTGLTPVSGTINGRSASICRVPTTMTTIGPNASANTVCTNANGCVCNRGLSSVADVTIAQNTACPTVGTQLPAACTGNNVALGTAYSVQCSAGNGITGQCREGYRAQDGRCVAATVGAAIWTQVCTFNSNLPQCPNNPDGHYINIGETCSGGTCLCLGGKMDGNRCVAPAEGNICYGSSSCINGRRYTCQSFAGPVGRNVFTNESCGTAVCVPNATEAVDDGGLNTHFRVCRPDGSGWITNTIPGTNTTTDVVTCATNMVFIPSERRCVPNPAAVPDNACRLIGAHQYAVSATQFGCSSSNSYICQYGPARSINGVLVCPDPQGTFNHGCPSGMFFYTETGPGECRYRPTLEGVESYAGYQCDLVHTSGLVTQTVCQACGLQGQPACVNCYGQGSANHSCSLTRPTVSTITTQSTQDYVNSTYHYFCNNTGTPNCQSCGGSGQPACPTNIGSDSTVTLLTSCDEVHRRFPSNNGANVCPIGDNANSTNGFSGFTCGTYTSMSSTIRCTSCGHYPEEACPTNNSFPATDTASACSAYFAAHPEILPASRPACGS